MPASAIAEFMALNFWKTWDDPAELRSFCDRVELNARSDRILLVLCAHQLFGLVLAQTLNRLGLDTRTAQVVVNNVGRYLAHQGVSRGYWSDAAAALDEMSDLGQRMMSVWIESTQKPPSAFWYVGMTMIEAMTGAPVDETKPESTATMSLLACPDIAGLAELFGKLRAEGSEIVGR